ncbi:acyl-CoA dehydrogenase family protein [Antrihabitans sp. YC2-6]|uniref:acyl-CoA dehydrogenase family protein n=1 Tax=Antrihabitans sp. YC2-6 TaxID=2799498 RepID=UPI0018F6711D|nr:acyl-CoA dehydrogenase family protein [Antrihabitans sp. YC2-6]MBJ8348499.1 acyl-CoA/acyl-ACP dehydrogenase [Antrihabitans sp. YC2-6]
MYEWSETDLLIQDAIRQFVDAEVRPHVEALESGEMKPYPIIRKLFAAFGIDQMARESIEKMLAKEEEREAAGPDASGDSKKGKKQGGSLLGGQEGMGLILVKELCAVSMGLCAAIGVSLGLGATTIMARGTLAQKKRWLPELATFEKVAAWALTEPDSGSDAFGGMKTYVRRDGEDYILNGQKTFITNGPDADVIVVYAKLDEGDGADKRNRKVLTFVLDSGMEGLTQPKAFKKMGMNSSPTGELFFDNVRVGKDRLLGETENHEGGDGRDSAKSGFVMERMGVAAMALGVIEECLRVCTAYAKNRKLWGQPISDFQLIQLKLAKMELARVQVQNMVFRGIDMARDGKTPSLAEASAVKWYTSEAATDVAMEAVQLLGGNGYMREYHVEQLARDAKSLMIYAGSNEVQITHVAKGLLA